MYIFIFIYVYIYTTIIYIDITEGDINCVAGTGSANSCCEEGFSAVEGWDPAGGDLFCLHISTYMYKMNVNGGRESVLVTFKYICIYV
jgi:hypothetical protein